MNGGLFPFVAGCIFFGTGALLIGSLLGFLVRRLRVLLSMGRIVGRVVALETLSSTAGKQTLAFYLNGNLGWLGPDWQRYEP